MLHHEFFKERQPVHARHLDIERDHVGDLLADALSGNKGIAGGRDDLDLGIGGEQVASVWRTTAESSTTSTRVFALFISWPRACGGIAAPAASAAFPWN